MQRFEQLTVELNPLALAFTSESHAPKDYDSLLKKLAQAGHRLHRTSHAKPPSDAKQLAAQLRRVEALNQILKAEPKLLFLPPATLLRDIERLLKGLEVFAQAFINPDIAFDPAFLMIPGHVLSSEFARYVIRPATPTPPRRDAVSPTPDLTSTRERLAKCRAAGK